MIEYLNSQGMLIYGLEVSFFSGPAECFVPRLVVKPRVTETRKLAATGSMPIAQEDFFQALPERVRDPASEFLHRAEAERATITWNSYGPSIRAARSPERVVSWLEKKRVIITVKPPAGYPTRPFDQARTVALQLPAGVISADDWYWSARYEELTDEQLDGAFRIALTLMKALATPIKFGPVEAPISVTFERNDHNIWSKSASALASHVGDWLRGTLQTGDTCVAVALEPLAGGSPGWRPRFEAAADAQAVWPTGELNGAYELTINELGTAQSPG